MLAGMIVPSMGQRARWRSQDKHQTCQQNGEDDVG